MTHALNTMTKRHQEYITPPHIIDSLGTFDLDPCPCPTSPIPTASKDYCLPDHNGLTMPWYGRVWLNPPYGRETGRWLGKMAEHNQGTALIFARTDVDFFHRLIFKKASGILFLKGRLTFHNHDGELYKHNSGAPSCLVSYGMNDLISLRECGLEGSLMVLK